jgi:hypothetical protein
MASYLWERLLAAIFLRPDERTSPEAGYPHANRAKYGLVGMPGIPSRAVECLPLCGFNPVRTVVGSTWKEKGCK